MLGVNIQVLADRKGKLLWASAALPGAVHDVKAARTHGIPAALIKFGVACYADNAYRGAGPTIAVPFRRGPRPLSKAQGRSTPPTLATAARANVPWPRSKPGNC